MTMPRELRTVEDLWQAWKLKEKLGLIKFANKINSEMMTMVLNGSSCKAAGKRKHISGSRVRKIVAKFTRILRHPEWLDESIPKHDFDNLNELRSHKAFWLRRLSRFREEKKATRI